MSVEKNDKQGSVPDEDASKRSWAPWLLGIFTRNQILAIGIGLPFVVHHLFLHKDMIGVYNDRDSAYHLDFALNHAGIVFISMQKKKYS